MTRAAIWVASLASAGVIIFAICGVCVLLASESPQTNARDKKNLPTTVVEAKVRARILHETIHGALQVVHRDFFNDDDRGPIPSRSLEDVFEELEDSWQVSVRWLVVSADAMNVDNKPRDDFEKQAAKALATGETEYESVENNVYRYAGSIRLGSQCLKCHAPRRTSNAERAAGLAITMKLSPDR